MQSLFHLSLFSSMKSSSMKSNIFPDKLTHHARRALITASNIAQEYNHRTVDIVHLLYAITHQKGSAGAHFLTTLSLTPQILLPYIKRNKSTCDTCTPMISTQLKDALVRAYKIAGTAGNAYVGTEHLAHAILETKDTVIQALLKKIHHNVPYNINNDGAGDSIQIPYGDNPITQLAQLIGNTATQTGEDGEESTLEHFTTDLSTTTHNTTLIGRDKSIADIITILMRKEKSNPLLIGEPGVGKTAIVEGLAQRIRNGDVPAPLLNARILTLDLADLVAGTTYRGEFEARIKDLIAEVTQQDSTIILFIDELHMIVGAGNTQGSLDVANILKPALSRGTLRMIGATTPKEYKKHISKDTALARRFHVVSIAEPSRDECITILTGVRSYYERFHNITITPKHITQIVDWSIRYLPTRHLPDKAFDILDEAAAHLRANATHDDRYKKLILLERTYRNIIAQKTHAINNEDYGLALQLRHKEAVIHAQITKQKKELAKKDTVRALTITDIAHAVARLAKIPLHKVLTTTPNALHKNLTQWQKTIIGQDDAVKAITQTLLRSFAGITPSERPTGSFLFLGPTGVGKTLTATTLAQTLFTHDKSLIRIDMSELSEKHTVAKLLGAPAGYIGHGDGGTLTEQIRTNPYSVVLFDEIEKAHPNALNLLLQILDTGTLTDATGDIADFRHAIIILTSNIGTDALTKSAHVGFTHTERTSMMTSFNRAKTRVLAELRDTIKPEILNRLDNIIVFRPLERATLTSIARTEIRALKKSLASTNIRLTTTPTVASIIARKAITENADAGARGIRHALRTYLEDPLAQQILTHQQRPLTLHAHGKSDTITITVRTPKRP